MKEKANYVKLTVKLSNTIETKYYDSFLKKCFFGNV